jgi:hypothetical protein
MSVMVCREVNIITKSKGLSGTVIVDGIGLRF